MSITQSQKKQKHTSVTNSPSHKHVVNPPSHALNTRSKKSSDIIMCKGGYDQKEIPCTVDLALLQP